MDKPRNPNESELERNFARGLKRLVPGRAFPFRGPSGWPGLAYDNRTFKLTLSSGGREGAAPQVQSWPMDSS